ncbi:hypothetical protein D0862_08496 [Hortaea werneckii]|uniref:Type 1 phosphatases regulator n=1 Tax=Hortaea werneckii TaxID=91943 RepID=A0A3M7G7N0_HORWE|nr:hypothetical protein D0862_08496 [Hortaea werneckii]
MSNHPPTHLRTSNNAPTSGSQTITSNASGPSAQPTLRLRAEETPQQPEPSQHVRWAEDVVDNEGMGKKSSKVCCIYHKPHDGADSSGEDSSSSSSDGEGSDSEPDLSRAQKAGGSGKGKGKGKGRERKPSPNAYERQPRYGGGSGSKGGKKKEEQEG